MCVWGGGRIVCMELSGENSECGSMHEYGDKCSVCVNMCEGESKSVYVCAWERCCAVRVCVNGRMAVVCVCGCCVCVCMAHMYEVGMGCWLQQSPDAGPGG